MRLRVHPCGPLTGQVRPPGDKSISHRAAILSAVARATARIEGFLECEDCLRTAEALRALGARIDPVGASTLEVHGGGLEGLGAPGGPL
ncbi:MAG: 3-phosphoshikimate 1-carboxyvinyltransferase, partial [Armatimonadota bacterium]